MSLTFRLSFAGSHLDAVPQGGNYDGSAGVIAGVVCLARMRAEGVIPPRTLKVIALRGEESAWFGKPNLGRVRFSASSPRRTWP